MTVDEMVEVAVVGAGPAGATLAARLALRGVRVLVLERAPGWHWKAGGVFASPAAVRELRRAGLSETTIAAVAEPIPAMRLETPGGATVRLTSGSTGPRWIQHSSDWRRIEERSSSAAPRSAPSISGRRTSSTWASVGSQPGSSSVPTGRIRWLPVRPVSPVHRDSRHASA